VPQAQIVIEPEARNTAACIGLAAVSALAEGRGDPVLVVLPADHAVKDEEALRRALTEGITEARRADVLVTIGIPPTSPHTGYGYIKRGACLRARTFHVERFFEKPSLERAKQYLEGGDYWWNSGMFVWRASVILNAFKTHLPTMYSGLQRIAAMLEEQNLSSTRNGVSGKSIQSEIASIFSGFESISIDFGVLEHARNCVIVEAEPFGWNDVGSWDQWADNFQCDSQGNLVKGDAIAIDSTGCVVKSERRLIAAVGLKDVVIIDSGDALLVVSREHVQDVRKVVDELKRLGRNELV
jgi:mannose-1-phosphate guanylyltransferase